MTFLTSQLPLFISTLAQHLGVAPVEEKVMKTEPSIDSLFIEKVAPQSERSPGAWERKVKSNHRITRLPAT